MSAKRIDFGPAVLDGKIRYTSVSQITTFDVTQYGGCKRRWWFRNVGKIPEPPRAATDLGTLVHGQIEHLLRTGESQLGDIARAGSRFIPVRRLVAEPALLIEHGFGENDGANVRSLLLAGDVPVVGFVDLMHRRGEYADGEGVMRAEPGAFEVADWKTSSDIDRLAKTGPQLLDTVQMVGYGELGRLMWPDLKYARLSHVYFQTKGAKKAEKRTVRADVAEISRRWLRIAPVAESMRSCAGVSDPMNVDPNYDACGAWGGCPYREKCPRDLRQQLLSFFKKESDMSLAEKIAKRKAEAEAAAMSTKAAPTPPTPAAVAAEKAALVAEEKVALTPPGDPPSDAPIADPIPPESSQKVPAATYCLLSSTQSKLSTDDVAERKATCAKCGERVKVKPQKLGDGAYYAQLPQHGVVKAEMKEKEKKAPPPQEIVTNVGKTHFVGDDCAGGHANVKAQYEEEKNSLILYLDCCEDGVAAQRLETYVAAVCRELEAAAGAAEVRCAPETSALAFGKWKGALSAALRERPPTGAWLVDGRDEVSRVAFDALAPIAKRVVRGWK